MRSSGITPLPFWLAAFGALALGACTRESSRLPRDSLRSQSARPTPVVQDGGATQSEGSSRAEGSSTALALASGDECAVEVRTETAPGWSIVGLRPGPALRDIVDLGHHRLAALTSRRVCTSDDGGLSWQERFAVQAEGVTLSFERVGREGSAWLLLVRRAPSGSEHDAMEVSEAYVSRDGSAERWERLRPPAGADPMRSVFSDSLGRVFVAAATELFESEDLGASWSRARALPGREAREVDACGTLLIARARVDQDWFYHRSFDRGLVWRPFRLGAAGLEGPSALVRCLGDRGGVEAGRPPLPSRWSWDGGLTWSPAPYDQVARSAARALAEDPRASDLDAPHCDSVAGGLLACSDPGRLRLLRPGQMRAQEIHAPSACEHVRQVDAARTFAFGPSCGIYLSTDRGGLWRALSQSFAGRPAGGYAEGRGGFVDARTAWRLDGGVWWTTDGGAHWRPFFSIGGRALERGVFVDTRRGVFATAGGWIVATRDGGRSWTYVLRGEVERIASARRAVVVTTTQTVRISPDGGATWLAAGAMPPQTPLDPTLELSGARRSVAIAPGVRVTQEGDRIVLERRGASAVDVVRGLPPGYNLVAAHAEGTEVDRVMLEGGVILARSVGEAERRAVHHGARRGLHRPRRGHRG